jgi:hypothetical protein
MDNERRICLTHLFSLAQTLRLIFFRHAFLYRLGAMFPAATPLIQLEQQNDALFPFPIKTYVRAKKSVL